MEKSATPRFQNWVPFFALTVNVVTMLATIVLTGIALRELVPSLSEIAKNTELVRLQQEMAIITPPDGATVQENVFASGVSPFVNRLNFLIVVPVTGGKWVQEGAPLSVGPDGFWSNSVRLGEQQLGCEKEFQLLLLATSERLQPGAINVLPRDAVLSKPVTVRRAPCPQNQQREQAQ